MGLGLITRSIDFKKYRLLTFYKKSLVLANKIFCFVSDANGRQMMERIRQPARTVKDIFEPSNYYPVTARRVHSNKKAINPYFCRKKSLFVIFNIQLLSYFYRCLVGLKDCALI